MLESLRDGVPDLEVPVLGRVAEALGTELGGLLEGIEWVPDGRGGGCYRIADSGPGSDR